jgi:hypothetical protein
VNQHQINGLASFIEMLNSAAQRGIVIPNSMDVEIDGVATGLVLRFDAGYIEYRAVPA